MLYVVEYKGSEGFSEFTEVFATDRLQACEIVYRYYDGDVRIIGVQEAHKAA